MMDKAITDALALIRKLDELAQTDKRMAEIRYPTRYSSVDSRGNAFEYPPRKVYAEAARKVETEQAILEDWQYKHRKSVNDLAIAVAGAAHRYGVDWEPVVRYITTWKGTERETAIIKARMLVATIKAQDEAAAPSPPPAPFKPLTMADLRLVEDARERFGKNLQLYNAVRTAKEREDIFFRTYNFILKNPDWNPAARANFFRVYLPGDPRSDPGFDIRSLSEDDQRALRREPLTEEIDGRPKEESEAGQRQIFWEHAEKLKVFVRTELAPCAVRAGVEFKGFLEAIFHIDWGRYVAALDLLDAMEFRIRAVAGDAPSSPGQLSALPPTLPAQGTLSSIADSATSVVVGDRQGPSGGNSKRDTDNQPGLTIGQAAKLTGINRGTIYREKGKRIDLDAEGKIVLASLLKFKAEIDAKRAMDDADLTIPADLDAEKARIRGGLHNRNGRK